MARWKDLADEATQFMAVRRETETGEAEGEKWGEGDTRDEENALTGDAPNNPLLASRPLPSNSTFPVSSGTDGWMSPLMDPASAISSPTSEHMSLLGGL